MKEFDRKYIFSWANCEEAKQYIGKEGFIGNRLGEINENVKRGCTVTLQDVEDDTVDCFYFEMGIFKDCSAGLFLPLDKVKEVEEKKYRPFKNIDEFMNHLDLKCLMNNYIKVEDINTSEIYELMIVGAFVNRLVLPLYGALTMDQLFRKFKLKFNDQFVPFGVLDES